jgi:ketopantoate hydroxymethyltransferase
VSATPKPPPRRKVTTLRLQEMKAQGEKIAALTAYDWLMAKVLDESGIDVILVGDSAAMVFCGYDTTISMTMPQMLYHAGGPRSARWWSATCPSCPTSSARRRRCATRAPS